jgi:cytidine deaminase
LRIVHVAVVARSENGQLRSAAPCGSCRQFIAELGPAAIVLYHHGSPELRRRPITELLPDAFDRSGST